MGGPAARVVDDCLQLGLVYHAWPFPQAPGTLRPRDLRYLMARTTALMPAAPEPDEEPDV